MQRNIFISGTKTVVFAPSVTGSVCLPKCGRFFWDSVQSRNLSPENCNSAGGQCDQAYILFFGCMKTKQPEAYTQALPCMIRPRWPGSVTLHAYGPPPSLHVVGCLILPIFLSRFPFTLLLISQQYWIFFLYGISD